MNSQSARIRGAAVAAAAVLITALAGCAPSAPTPQGTETPAPEVARGVTFSLAPGSLTNIAEYVGIDMGYFEKYGIYDSQIVASTSGSTTLQLLAAGQLNFGAINIPSSILAEQTSGVDLRVAVGMMKKYPASLVCNKDVDVSEDYPDGIADLVGLTVASDSPVSSSTADFLVTLRENDVDPADVNMVYIQGGNATTIAAMQSGQVDCAMVYEPAQTQLGDTVKTVFDIANDKAPQVVIDARYNVLTVTGDYAVKNPKIIAAVQNAMKEITALLADPDNAQDIAEGVHDRYPDFSVDDLAAVIARLAPVFENGAEITQAQYDANIEIFNIANQQNIDIPYEDVVLPLP